MRIFKGGNLHEKDNRLLYKRSSKDIPLQKYDVLKFGKEKMDIM